VAAKIILCLANSRKLSGRCIAGREITPDGYAGWVRPISARVSAEVSEEERRYENGSDPRVLDIIEVPVLAANPHLHQVENWVIDTGGIGARKARRHGRAWRHWSKSRVRFGRWTIPRNTA
jgi:hypothetical protein